MSEELLQEMVKAAPVLTMAIGGVLIIARMLLKHHRDELNDRQRVAEERHKTYFAQLEAMNRATTNAIESNGSVIRENTQVLARVLDRMAPGS